MTQLPNRCGWTGDDTLMQLYHDAEWGTPLRDEQRQFEFLTLEAFQAGLSWRSILHKRENFRKAFAKFDVEKVARFGEKQFDRLMNDAGIIRNKLKIESAIHNAKLVVAMHKKGESLSEYLWSFVDNKPVVNHWKSLKEIPATSKLSDQVSKDLKKHGFKFMGSIVVYSHLQATGIINDHTVDCFRRAEILKKKFK